MDVVKVFGLCFVPLFVALGPVSLVPVYVGLTRGFRREQRRAIIVQSFVTAGIGAVAFLLLGKVVLRLMGIEQCDFQIAGGIILLGLALPDILGFPMLKRDVSGLTVGVVPLGMPLMVGPGVLTALLLLSDLYGYVPTLVALIVNLVIAVLGFGFAGRIMRVMGETGTKAATRLVGLFLAAYAVMLIRDGVVQAVVGAR